MNEMKLNNDNYYSQKANQAYFSVSQVKDFLKCEAYAMAKLEGEWVEPPSTAMLIGSYVDSYFEGTLEDFIENHPDMFVEKKCLNPKFISVMEEHPEYFTKALDVKAKYKETISTPEKFLYSKKLNSKYQIAEKAIEKVTNDELFMNCMSGEKQVIMTGELFGAKWKIKMDSYIPHEAIVDLKVVQKLRDVSYKNGWKQSFIEKWGYDLQLGIYQEIVRQNTGETLPCIIAAVDKQDYPDLDCILIPDDQLKFHRDNLRWKMQRIIDVKNYNEKPKRCGVCDYCRATKKLEKLIFPDDLIVFN